MKQEMRGTKEEGKKERGRKIKKKMKQGEAE